MEVTMANVIRNSNNNTRSLPLYPSDILFILRHLLQCDVLYMIYNRAFQRTQTKILLYATCIMPLCASNELMANDNHIVMPPQNKMKLELKTNSHLIRFARAAVSHLVENQIKNYGKTHYYRILYTIIFGEMKENVAQNSLCSPANGKF